MGPSLRSQAISRDVLNCDAGSLDPALYRPETRGLIEGGCVLNAVTISRDFAGSGILA